MKRFTLLFGLLTLTACAQITKTEEGKAIQEKDSTDSFPIEFDNQTDPYEYFTSIDTHRWKYNLPTSFIRPENWKKKQLEGEWYGAEFSDSLNLVDVLAMIDTSSQFWLVCKAKSWCVKNYHDAFPHLIARLSVKEKLGLRNTADLIIHCRMHTGDLEFYGHGGVIKEDLFTAAGRASWILNEITGEEFASVQGNMTPEKAEAYKAQWVGYIAELRS